MDRREFCRRVALIGGATVLSPLVKACGPIANPVRTVTQFPPATADSRSIVTEAPTSGPQLATTEMKLPDATSTVTGSQPVAKIALVKTSDRSTGVREAIRILGIDGMKGDNVLLKPNYNSADPSPGSTHPETLRSLIVELHEMGARSILVGDRSGMGNTRPVMQQLGVLDLATSLGFDTVCFEELTEQDWTMIRSADFHWHDGFAVPRLLLDSDKVVQTCNLKTHRYGGHFTMALKNSVGLVAKTVGSNGHNYMSELHSSPYQRLMIGEINSAYSADLIVMDGIEAFVTGGPAKGHKVNSEVILAGIDPIAIDAVGVSILRLFGTTPEVSQGKIFEQEQIARAVELGLGISSPQNIRLVTADPDSADYARQITAVLTD